MRWLLIRVRTPFLVLLLLLTALMAWPLTGLQVDHSNAAMVARDPQQQQTYERYKQLFGQDEYLLLSVTSPRLLDPEGLQLIESLTKRIQSIPEVRSVFSLSNARQINAGQFGADILPLIALPTPNPGNRQLIKQSLAAHSRLAELLISADRQTAALTIELENLAADDPRQQQLVQQLRQLMREQSAAAEFHLTGTLVQKQDVASFVLRDQQVLVPLSVLVLALCLICSFRQISGVLLPLLVTGISLVWTLGCYALAGLTLNTITSLLPPVIMVLSVATSIHIYNGWQRLPKNESEPRAQLIERVRELRRPCFYTALTTALGLLSLTLSNIPAIRNFGLFAALGVMISFAVGITLVPVGLSYLDHGQQPRPPSPDSVLARLLRQTARLSTRRAATVFGLALLLSLISLPGFSRISNNTDLVRFLRTDAPLYRDTMFIDRALNGVYPFDFMLSRNDGRPLTSVQDVEKISRFEQSLDRQAGIGSVISLVDLISRLHQVETGATTAEPPADSDQLGYYFDLLQASPDQHLLSQLGTADFITMRISARSRALGTADVERMITQVLQEAEEIFGPAYRLEVTGSYYRISRESNALVRTLLKSFGVSLVLVMLAIGLMFRSWSLTLVALVPNLIPLFWTGGLMGFVGIDLSTGTAMIGAVAFGLIVDATIHYLSHYQKVVSIDPTMAIEQTTTGIGRALAISSLVLVLGFWVGCFGSFKPTIYFSLLVGTTMIGALICDLLVLPACLTLHARLRKGAV